MPLFCQKSTEIKFHNNPDKAQNLPFTNFFTVPIPLFEINHRRINTIKYIDLKWFFKQAVPFFPKVYHTIHLFLCMAREHVIKYRFWTGINQVHPKSFTSSERESACSVNRTNPSPLHSRYIFIYIQKEFWQEGGERKKSIQRHKRQKSPFVSIMEGENLLILYSLWTKENFDFFCPFKRYINDGSM